MGSGKVMITSTRTGKLKFSAYFKKKQQIKRDIEEREVFDLLAKAFPTLTLSPTYHTIPLRRKQ